MRDLAARIRESLAGYVAQSGAVPDLDDDEDGAGEAGWRSELTCAGT